MKRKLTVIGLGLALFGVLGLNAQTTLDGDHVIDGNLNIGTSITSGVLNITGQTGSSAAPGIKVTGDGGVVFVGNQGTGLIPATGVGARMMWYSKKAAFRVGYITSASDWADSEIGVGSFASSRSIASGLGATAFGRGQAHGTNSVAMSFGTASGIEATAMSGGTANGNRSVAMNWAIATGVSSVAMIDGSAQGNGSFAIGAGAIAQGNSSVTIGAGSTAVSFHSFVIGKYNTNEGNPSTWVESDPLFVIGNGTGNVADPVEIRNRNAFLVKKNGDIVIPKRQGDILMGNFGDPE